VIGSIVLTFFFVIAGLDPRLSGLEVPQNRHFLHVMAGEGRPSTSFTCATEVVDARDEHGHDEGEIDPHPETRWQ
jgi:hypothetical protein